MRTKLAVVFWVVMVVGLVSCWAQALTAPADLQTKPFSQWQLNLVTLGLIAQALGRAYTAVRAGGGLVGIWRSVVFGSTTTVKVLVAMGLIGLLGLMAACTTTQQRVAVNTLFSLEQGATAAVDGYDSRVIKGVLPTNDVPRVSALYNKFQASMLVALDAVQFNSNAIAPPSLAVESQDLVNLIMKLEGK